MPRETVGYCPNCGREVKSTSYSYDSFYFCQPSCRSKWLMKAVHEESGGYSSREEEKPRQLTRAEELREERQMENMHKAMK